MIVELEKKLNELPKTISVDDTIYCLRIVPLTEEIWEVSYFKLNDNGDKDKNNKKPVLRHFMGNKLSNVVDEMLKWIKEKNF